MCIAYQFVSIDVVEFLIRKRRGVQHIIANIHPSYIMFCFNFAHKMAVPVEDIDLIYKWNFIKLHLVTTDEHHINIIVIRTNSGKIRYPFFSFFQLRQAYTVIQPITDYSSGLRINNIQLWDI